MTFTAGATSANSAASHGAQVSRSVTEGLLTGGAQRTAATILAPISRWPSPAAVEVGMAASPQRYSEANSTSPLRSPVKIRPVRFPPCAAGASPRISTRASSSPHPGTGRPQYCWVREDARLTAATSSRHATSRGQARHTDCRAISSSRPPAAAASPASARTPAALVATGVAGVAGSPGQPLPGGTGRPVTAAGPVTGPCPPPGTRPGRRGCRAHSPAPRRNRTGP